MAGEAAPLARTWSVGSWKVTLTVPAIAAGSMLRATMEWAPRTPDRPLTSSELRQYRAGRDRAVAELADALGISAAVLEVGR